MYFFHNLTSFYIFKLYDQWPKWVNCECWCWLAKARERGVLWQSFGQFKYICISDLKLNKYTSAHKFRQRDCRDSHTLTTALNQSFQDGRGGALHCKLTPSQLLDSLTEGVLAKDNVVRRQLTTVGDQSEDFSVVSPQVALDINGKQVTRSNYYDH